MNTALGKIADGLFVIVYISEIFTFAGFYVLMNRHTLHDTPHHTLFSHHILPGTNFLHRPYLSVRNMMQGVNNIRNTGLSYIVEAHRVIRPVPPPAFFHQIHNYYIENESNPPSTTATVPVTAAEASLAK